MCVLLCDSITKLTQKMSLKTWAAQKLAAMRVRQIRKLVAMPREAQTELLLRLLAQARDTAFGRDHGFASIRTHADYAQAVPVRDYEALRLWIDRAYGGTPDVLWPGRPLYFAKTSGTTSGTKYIPLTRPSMQCQVKGARDALFCYIHETRDTRFLDGKMIFLSGSPTLELNAAGIPVGRLSGIAQHFVPSYLQRNRVPTYATNCIEDWETKVAKIVEETVPQDLRLVSGIPPWVQMFFEQVTAATGKAPAQVWPNLNVFVQGGVDYTPYRDLITHAFGKPLRTVEVFPASEGFVAVQDSQLDPALLLMLDYGIFFEFIPLAEYGQPHARRLPLWEVAVGEQYALILSTNAGLWAYDIGDVVKFTSTAPYKLRVTGRVKHFISAFGEHVIQEEVTAAMAAALAATGAQVAEFTVAPLVAAQGSRHEWYVEFLTPPADLSVFAHVLDGALQQQNVYYKDLRAGEMLAPAAVFPLQPDACRAYMKSIGKLGGQNKFPKLKNDRSMAEALQPYVLG
jgi:hypothetical protein